MFHHAFGHHIKNCLALGHQLDELVKSGFLKDYRSGPLRPRHWWYLKRIKLMRCPSTERSTPSLVDSQVGGAQRHSVRGMHAL